MCREKHLIVKKKKDVHKVTKHVCHNKLLSKRLFMKYKHIDHPTPGKEKVCRAGLDKKKCDADSLLGHQRTHHLISL